MKWTRLALTTVLLGAVASCDRGPTGPENPVPRFTHAPGTVGMDAETERLWVCKDGPAGTYNFSVDYTGGPGNQIIVGAFSVNAGTCVHIASSGVPLTASIFETAPLVGTHLDNITVDYAGNNVTPAAVFVPARSVDVTIGEDTDGTGGTAPSGATVTFFNVQDPPTLPPGGCTPGYWKEPEHFDSWPAGIDPTDDFSSIFADAFPGQSLLQVLSADGGKLIALGRHAVAAYLNASTLNYGMTPAEVVTLFNNAFASGNKDFIEAQKKILENLNQQQLCPLN